MQQEGRGGRLTAIMRRGAGDIEHTEATNKGRRGTVAFTAAFLMLGLALASSANFAVAAPHAAPIGQGSFAVLAGTAVTCTDSTITGDIGVSPGTAITQTNCNVSGGVHSNDAAAQGAYADFLNAYNSLAAVQCDQVLTGTLAGVTLSPGVYCFDAAATLTGTLTLSGGANAVWIFKIGTGGTGALTGTNFNVVLTGGADACNVFWWVAEAATMTTSNFVGSIYAGMAITVTGGTFMGNAYAKAAVTLTGVSLVGCEGGHRTHGQSHGNGCNQGVGNGPENCDPGNSNQGDASRSNDETGGTPGSPGRQGGNGK